MCMVKQFCLFVYLFIWCNSPTRARAASFLRFLDHTQRHTTRGRVPLHEGSARRRVLHLQIYDTHHRQPYPPPGFLVSSVLHVYYFFVLIVLAVPFALTVRHKHPCPRRDTNPAIPASDCPQTLDLDGSATGIGSPRKVQQKAQCFRVGLGQEVSNVERNSIITGNCDMLVCRRL